jgi:exocyst complex component 3
MLERDVDELLSDTLIDKIQEQIYEKFHEEFLDKSEINEILETSISFGEDLILVFNKVVPCFPPKYNIFQVYKDNYLKFIYAKIRPYMTEESLKQNPTDLIAIAKWLDKFEDILNRVGVDIRKTELGTVIVK